MFFANDIYGNRIYIDDAEAKQSYFCPACKSPMIQKRGNVNAHHFAHRSGKECDPWYVGKRSAWHTKMQNYFSKREQEVVIWNEAHTEYHIADVALQCGNKKYVFEFQHSAISQDDFVSRSKFYMKCGYRLIWIFDFYECKKPKKIFIAEDGFENNIVRLVWPGNDRIRFLNNINFSNCNDRLYILFHINTGKGKRQLHTPDGYYPWETWEYINPLCKSPCFVSLCLNNFNGVFDFFGKVFSEREFFEKLQKHCYNINQY